MAARLEEAVTARDHGAVMRYIKLYKPLGNPQVRMRPCGGVMQQMDVKYFVPCIAGTRAWGGWVGGGQTACVGACMCVSCSCRWTPKAWRESDNRACLSSRPHST